MKGSTPYLHLPPLAGLSSFQDATRPGISVNDCVDRLKRYHYALQRLWSIYLARLTAEPVYELKMAFSHHAYLCSEHISALRDRVAEMRHPPLGLEKVPDDRLKMFFDEILAAPTTYLLLCGLYEQALPALQAGLEKHLRETNPLADQPTVRVLRFALADIEPMIDYGRKALQCLRDPSQQQEVEGWTNLLIQCLEAAGGLDGTSPASGTDPLPCYSARPFVYDKTPRRDERFPDPYNMGVHAEEFLYQPDFPATAKTLMMYFKRLREIDVPEMMATILVESPDRPWEFYRDMTRQLWDEARHAMMGEVGFRALGIDWPKQVKVNFTWSKGLNEQLSPQERHAVLWFIEQGLMSKTGKRYEWEVGKASGDPLSMLFQDYDWADEVLHARIGRDWYVKDFPNPEQAANYGSQCWSKVVSGWREWKEQGLTQHHNWWPDLYQAYCRQHGVNPDPKALAFHTTYEETRADLQRITGSA